MIIEREHRNLLLGIVFLSIFIFQFSFCQAADSTQVAKKNVYGGMVVKFDLASAIITPALYNWKMQQYEVAMNWRVINRLYPTFEVGYAGGQTTQGDSLYYNAHGGFFRVGCDINPLKKHPESPHAMLIGLRVGTGIQAKKTDCWGEVVAGCQVNIVKGLYMGWMGRLKILFTREKEGLMATEMDPIYIPGFGSRNNVGWGVSYHIGYKF